MPVSIYNMTDLLSRWLHAIVTVPDGRVLVHRTHYGNASGITPWIATIGVSSMGRREHMHTLTRRLFNKFGIKGAKAELLAVHTPAKSAYDHRSYYPVEIYHMHLENMTTLLVSSKVEIMALPFESILNDLDSGVWDTDTVEILNIIDGLPIERFKIWNTT